MTRFLTADEAAERLGVRKATLYTYASRGWIRTRRDGRRRGYAAEDVEHLRERSAAVAGEGPAAAGALDFGAPVLASAITRIGPDGPRYRRRLATALAAADIPFEAVFGLLVDGTPPESGPERPVPSTGTGTDLGAAAGRTVAGRLVEVAARLANRALDGAEDLAGLALVRCLAARTAGGPIVAGADLPVAATLALAFGAPPDRARWIDRALVLCADHELNASAFAARVAAGTGAGTAGCLVAALAAWSGPRHGGATDAVERWAASVRDERDAGDAVSAARRQGFPPAFGHRLYPDGDPRAAALLDWAEAIDPVRSAPIRALAAAGAAASGEPPSLDLGLVAFARALDLPPGGASALFAIGRCAGWLAHVEEQRRDGRMLRPRAAPA